MRTYLPTTLPGLRELAAGRPLPEPSERFTAPGEDEAAEYDALMAAAGAAAALLPDGGRRVVVVAELDRPGGAVALGDVVAVHCDTRDRPAGADPDDDLAWFATQEIPDLV